MTSPLWWTEWNEEEAARDFNQFLDQDPDHRTQEWHLTYGKDPTFCGKTVGGGWINVAALLQWPGMFEQVRFCHTCLIALARIQEKKEV